MPDTLQFIQNALTTTPKNSKQGARVQVERQYFAQPLARACARPSDDCAKAQCERLRATSLQAHCAEQCGLETVPRFFSS